MRPRIGWQIDAGVNGQALGNNMLAHLDDWQRREGRIAASTLWRPACSFMADTAEVLLGFVERQVPGVVHVDSNAHEALVVCGRYKIPPNLPLEKGGARGPLSLEKGAARGPPLIRKRSSARTPSH